MARKSTTKITFENNKGETMLLDGKLTIKDLVKMGIKNVSLIKAEKPLKDGCWRNQA